MYKILKTLTCPIHNPIHTKEESQLKKILHMKSNYYYNWLMRTYNTPEKLNRYYSAKPDICIKCEKEKGTFFHCVW